MYGSLSKYYQTYFEVNLKFIVSHVISYEIILVDHVTVLLNSLDSVYLKNRTGDQLSNDVTTSWLSNNEENSVKDKMVAF